MYSISIFFLYSGKPYIGFFLTGMRGDQFFAPVETGTLTAGEDYRRKGDLFIVPAKRWDQAQGTVGRNPDIPDNYVHAYTNAVIMDNKSLRSKKNVPGLGKDRLGEKEKAGEKEER